MGYEQITINDWMEMKRKLRQELLGVKQSFVRIGYVLRKIEDQKLYEQDGYKSIAEFAKEEYGLEPSTTSRFMSINREYSIDGYSEHLRTEYAELGRSQLEEMLKLPDNDRTMVQPETSRQDIRELKRFNKTEPETGVADDLRQLIEKFYHDNPDILNAVFSQPEFDEQNIKHFMEIVNPGGNRSYKKGLFFLMMYENRVAIKKFGADPQNLTWWEFYQITLDIFGETEAGAEAWKNYFGEQLEERQKEEDTEEKSQSEEIAPAQKEKETKEKKEEKTEEYQTPHPEGFTSICYSCTEYEKCNVKSGTCTKCDKYRNREEEYKTEEQRYSEEQDKIDKETKKKIKEMEEERALETLPSEQEQKRRYIRAAGSLYERILHGDQSFVITKKDGYKTGEYITIGEFAEGKATGKTLEAMITHVEDDATSSAIDEGYCVINVVEVNEDGYPLSRVDIRQICAKLRANGDGYLEGGEEVIGIESAISIIVADAEEKQA